MLSLFFRRLLWTVPTLFVVSLLTFLVLSFVPPPPDPEAARLDRDLSRIQERRRERFLDLPRFLNPEPADVRSRAAAAVVLVAEGGPDADLGERELLRLGGAALPFVMPALEALQPAQRARVAVALAPLASRLHVANADRAHDPEQAVLVWRRFWDDRSIDFRPASVRTAIERLTRYRSESRRRELEGLGTYVLPALFETLPAPSDERSLSVARTLVELAATVTARHDTIPEGSSLEEASACVLRWRAWWLVHESDFSAFDGTARAAAMVKETRYGKWAAGAALDLGTKGASTHAWDRLARGSSVTLRLLFGAIFLGYAGGILMGVLAAARRRRSVDLALGAGVMALYAVPPAVLAALVIAAGAQTGGASLWIPTLVVAAGLLAAPARQQRTGLREAMSGEHVRAARARGASLWRALVVHGVRHALPTTVTLLTVEPPTALTAVFVVEAGFRLDGVGAAVVKAVAERDTSFLMLLSISAAIVAAVVVLVSDLVHATLDPRLRGRLAGGAA